ncbi:subunit NDUFA12 of NADH ubiquinone oxidoreductase [Chloropicon roscoffensis]|uniref:Subunit NDUFA12 of NADH ubiquinone oxidoreductase n=1 Tax=Chloropicon roscoffensis TaxID=1461544 RepID=A0AAX4P893_9CHLO|mmetsp:Transcript_998/g.3110  ORF Transcript_998/g.3110 Transcript_998/m.3110 type:complete len:159 (-) Transcript_998:110-586(-)
MSLSKWFGSGARLTQRLGNAQQRLALLFTRGELVGRDDLGNQYFRRMEYDPDLGVDKEQRWMKSPRGHNHVYNYDPSRTPVEWTGWLRGARSEPPTEQEIKQNAVYRSQMKLQVDDLKQREARRRRIKAEEEAEGEREAEEETLTLGETEYWTPGGGK